jgi:hypothetical protein
MGDSHGTLRGTGLAQFELEQEDVLVSAPAAWHLHGDAIGWSTWHGRKSDLPTGLCPSIHWVDGNSDAIVAIRGGADRLTRLGHELGDEWTTWNTPPFVVD